MEYVAEERLPLASVTATTSVKAMQVLQENWSTAARAVLVRRIY